MQLIERVRSGESFQFVYDNIYEKARNGKPGMGNGL